MHEKGLDTNQETYLQNHQQLNLLTPHPYQHQNLQHTTIPVARPMSIPTSGNIHKFEQSEKRKNRSSAENNWCRQLINHIPDSVKKSAHDATENFMRLFKTKVENNTINTIIRKNHFEMKRLELHQMTNALSFKDNDRKISTEQYFEKRLDHA